MPAVTWIDVQPESSARTSIKSFTDYLTESQDDAPVFTPSNRLCLSPETLNALESAEKLVDDVERQLSQMQFDDSLTDDTDEVDGMELNDERLHVQNVVKTVFQKGYYEPAPRPTFNRGSAAWKRRKDKSSKHRSSRVIAPSKPIDRGVEPVDECLLCKSGKAGSANEHRKAERGHAQERKIKEDRARKLNVQRAPAISIKGPLAVQSARIVDIQPDQRRVPAGRAPNVVTHECRHLERTSSLEPGPRRTPEVQQRRECSDRSALKYSCEAPAPSEENRAWHGCEEVRLDLRDFGLREPRILAEVDAVLEQQRNVIRQVHEAADKLDRFLAGKRPAGASDLPEDRPREQPREYDVASGIDAGDGAIGAPGDESPSMSRESLEPTKSATLGKRVIHGGTAAASNAGDPSSTAPSEHSNKIFEDSSKRNPAGKSAVEEARHSESFEGESSADESESDKSRSLESGIQLKNTGKEVSSSDSSFAESSVPTETKSNAGFVENLESSLSLKENNLASYLRRKANDTSLVMEHDNVDRSLNRNFSLSMKEECDEEKRSDKKKGNELRTSETDDERELHNYQFDADLLEEMNELVVETDKQVDEQVDDDVECKKDGSTEKLQDNPDGNSQKTSHMIDSIPDISTRETSAKNSQESCKMAHVSNHELSEAKEDSTQEAVKELSTESKIEMKLSEARDNLKILMRTMNAPVDNRADDERESSHIADQERDRITEMDEQRSADDAVPQIMKNITLRTDDARRKNCRVSMNANVITAERNNLSNDRSYIAVLQENSEARQSSLERQKLLLLTNLESCRIQSPNRAKRLFTSTVVDDAEPPVNFTRSKESSTIRQDSSSGSTSEGEIRLNSTASHSLGEIPRKTLETKSSCSTKGSMTTSSANLNNSSCRSAGELDGINGKSMADI